MIEQPALPRLDGPGTLLSQADRELIATRFAARFPIYEDPILIWALNGAVAEIQRQNLATKKDPPFDQLLLDAHQTLVLAYAPTLIRN